MKEETLLEQMTRVRPEVLNEEGLKLFNKIMEVIDERDELQERINKAKQYAHERLTFLENCFGGNDIEIRACITIHNEYLKILGGDVDDE